MPVARTPAGLIHFAHVPRCGGSAIENHLHGRFGTLGFLDRAYNQHSGPAWTASSPQHVDHAAFARLVPDSFLLASFAMVRHPAKRIESVFLYQRDVEARIPEGTALSDWLADLPALLRDMPFAFDNHLRPMTDLVPPGARVFRLEEQAEGMPQVVTWLDAQCGTVTGPRRIGQVNGRLQRLQNAGRSPRGPEPVLSAADLDRIAGIYAADYDRFGYDRLPGQISHPADRPPPAEGPA